MDTFAAPALNGSGRSPGLENRQLLARIEQLEKIVMNGRFKIFALGENNAGPKVAAHLGVNLASHEERFHPDRESYVRSLENVRRFRVFVMQNLYTDAYESVDQKLVKLLWFIGALRDADAEDITVVMPYLAYARSDRKVKSREGVITKYVAQ